MELNTIFFENGKIEYTVMLIGGIEQGIAKTFYEDGSRSIEVVYDKGFATGTSQEWYPSGNLKIEIEYLDGQPSGYRCYAEDGTMIPCEGDE